MKLNDWLTLLAIVLGPTIAVAITLATERFRRSKERRLQIMRMLLSTRHMPADPQYNIAINLIPAEFNKQTKVMEAWQKYHGIVREHPDKEAQADHQKRMNVAQSAMIFQVMRSVGLKLSEGDIQTEVYVSQGFVDRDNWYIASLRAMPEIATAMKAQVELTRTIVGAQAGAAPSGAPHQAAPAAARAPGQG